MGTGSSTAADMSFQVDFGSSTAADAPFQDDTGLFPQCEEYHCTVAGLVLEIAASLPRIPQIVLVDNVAIDQVQSNE
jgi:hypothetical protein